MMRMGGETPPLFGDEHVVAGSRVAAGGGGGGTGTDTTGKHRILAELKRVEQESRFFEDELEELDKSASVSTICEELLQFMEVRPDPLLVVTNGPINPIWDRWFEGPQDARGCGCMIL